MEKAASLVSGDATILSVLAFYAQNVEPINTGMLWRRSSECGCSSDHSGEWRMCTMWLRLAAMSRQRFLDTMEQVELNFFPSEDLAPMLWLQSRVRI